MAEILTNGARALTEEEWATIRRARAYQDAMFAKRFGMDRLPADPDRSHDTAIGRAEEAVVQRKPFKVSKGLESHRVTLQRRFIAEEEYWMRRAYQEDRDGRKHDICQARHLTSIVALGLMLDDSGMEEMDTARAQQECLSRGNAYLALVKETGTEEA